MDFVFIIDDKLYSSCISNFNYYNGYLILIHNGLSYSFS